MATTVWLEDRCDEIIDIQNGHRWVHDLDVVLEELIAEIFCRDSQGVLPRQVLHVFRADVWRQWLDILGEPIWMIALRDVGCLKSSALDGGTVGIFFAYIGTMVYADLICFVWSAQLVLCHV